MGCVFIVFLFFPLITHLLLLWVRVVSVIVCKMDLCYLIVLFLIFMYSHIPRVSQYYAYF
jgi:hypothetical protein